MAAYPGLGNVCYVEIGDANIGTHKAIEIIGGIKIAAMNMKINGMFYRINFLTDSSQMYTSG